MCSTVAFGQYFASCSWCDRQNARRRQNHVRIVHRHIGFVGAVHTQHAQRLPMRGRECPSPISDDATGRLSFSISSRSCVSQAALTAPPPHRPPVFRRQQRLKRTFNLSFVPLRGRIIRTHAHRLRPKVRQFIPRIENIFWQIDNHWPRRPLAASQKAFSVRPGYLQFV